MHNDNHLFSALFPVSGLSTAQTTNGYVAWLNIWDYEMSLESINALTCESEGNVLTQADMSIYGAAGYTYTDSFDCGEFLMIIQWISEI